MMNHQPNAANFCAESCKMISRCHSKLLPLVGLLLLATCASCGKREVRKTPETFPVTGKVAFTSALSLVGGSVEFESIANGPEFTANSVIGPDGAFSLKIPYVDQLLPGATAGPHKVRVLLPIERQGSGPGFVSIPGEFEVKPGDNHFTIDMPGKK
jgi:hypothetical protein